MLRVQSGDEDVLLRPVQAFHAHAVLFGAGALKSASADKGYWSAKNQSALIGCGVRENEMQPPVNVKSQHGVSSIEVKERLRNRRAGIDPLIGRAKHGG